MEMLQVGPDIYVKYWKRKRKSFEEPNCALFIQTTHTKWKDSSVE